MNVEQWPIDSVIPYARNPRKNEGAVLKVAASIKEYGWRQPIVVDAEGVVIAGHTRLLAAKHLKLETVPVHVASDMNPIQAKAYRLADNRVAQEAEWDDELLALEIEELGALGLSDLDALGFEDDELANLRVSDVEEPEGLTDPDEVPEPPEEPTTKPGDLWQLGRHRLLCGDSTKMEDVERLMDGRKADALITDPPYGIAYKSPSGKGMTKRGDYDVIKGDEMDFDPSCLFGYCEMIVSWGANHYADKLPPSAKWLVWDKREGDAINNNSDCELAWVSQGNSARLFHHKWNGMIKASEKDQKRVHPTQKPSALSEWVFETVAAGKCILDLFGGSGSTLIACEKTARDCCMMEIDPKYCDVIVQRWEDFTGQKAVLANG